MKVTLPYLVAILVRGEGSKTPVTVMPHEVEVLKAMHGEEVVQVTDTKPPVAEGTFETEDEYVRLQEYYRGNTDTPNPTREVFRNLEAFEAAFSKIGAGNDDDDGASKDELIAQAKELGIAANRNWGIAKLQAAIADAIDQQPE